MAKVNIGLRVEPETIAEIEEIARLMSAKTGGATVPPTEAARAALARGLAVLRVELTDMAQKGAKRPPRKA